MQSQAATTIARNSAAALLAGALAGALLAFAPLGAAAAVLACAALPVVWLMLKSPAWTLSVFWLVYSLQSTVFATARGVRGVLYPIYAFLLLNILLFLCRGRRNPLRDGPVFQFAVAMGLFLAVVLVGVFRVERGLPEFPFAAYQRVFVYSLGLLAAVQFWMDDKRQRFAWVQAFSSLVLSGWIIERAMQSGFGYRARTGINENYLTEVVAVGLVPLFGCLTGSEVCRGALRRALLWVCFLAGVYALVLLASRGMFAAFMLAIAVVMCWRVRPFTRLIAIFVLIAASGLVIAELPGAQGLRSRLSSGDVYSLNDRLYIWKTVLASVGQGSVPDLLLGHGLGTTTVLVNRNFAIYNSTHNAYLQLLYEYGLLGLAAFLACHILPLRRLLSRRDMESVTAAAMLIFMMGCALTGAETDNFQYWIILGFAVATACRAVPVPLVVYRVSNQSHGLTLACSTK